MPMCCVVPLEMNEGNSLGARVQSAYRLQCRKSHTRDLLMVSADIKSQRDIMYMKFLGVTSAESHWESKLKLVFVGDLYLLSNRTLHFYSKTNQMLTSGPDNEFFR